MMHILYPNDAFLDKKPFLNEAKIENHETKSEKGVFSFQSYIRNSLIMQPINLYSKSESISNDRFHYFRNFRQHQYCTL